MTNYELYFSTPEKAAEMQVSWEIYDRGFVVKHFDIDEMEDPEHVAFIPCELDDPAALYEWMIAEVSAE